LIDLEINFYTEFLNEGGNFYSGLAQFREAAFNHWVRQTFNHISEVNSVEEISPSIEEVNGFIRMGYEPSIGACHHKSRQISVLSEGEYSYLTGFILAPNSRYGFISHSFNLHQSKIKDFSRISNSDYSPEPLGIGYSFPFEYYGFEIPYQFVEEMARNEIGYQRPLLLDYLQRTGL
jgi:hypothetical protein